MDDLFDDRRERDGRRSYDNNIVLLKPMELECCPEVSEHIELLQDKLEKNTIVGMVSIAFCRGGTNITSISGIARRDPSLSIVECMRLLHKMLSSE